jgi:uncharacterized membrane protein
MVRRLLSGCGVPTLLSLTRLQLLVIANALLQLLDGYVTMLGVGRGFPEGNPLVRSMMTSFGDAGGILVAKLAALAFLFYLYRRRQHPLVEPGLAYVAVVYTVMAVLPWTMLLASHPG